MIESLQNPRPEFTMILDTLRQWRQYNAISPRFEKAFAFLQQVTDQTPVGRHEIAGDEVFALAPR
ncbi:MAG: DUF386 family protein [Lacunisphaera sp.]|nr:DUF386 family protein [Lacunisphaera sp.]